MMLSIVLEAAFRSLLMALAVWGCVRLLRVQAVLAQKVTWVLVLAAAALMPMVMRAPFLALNRALKVPVQLPLRALPQPNKSTGQREVPAIAVSTQPLHTAPTGRLTYKAKPSAAHRAQDSLDSLTATETVASPLKTDRLSRAVDTVAASANPPAQLLQALWGKAAGYWALVKIGTLALGIYLGICGLLLLRTLAGLGLALRLLSRSRPVEGLALEATGLKVRASADMLTPVTIGSTVLLPADYAEWDAAKLRIVLAHEQSHVRQGDFYLQLIAAVHAAIFWFSPLGWWLQSKLSELGEALGDRAGLEQAPDAASYAQVLLEFAAIPRKTSFFQPVAGVAMARSSNLSSLSGRIERVLNTTNFRLAFLGGRRHAVLAAILVPAALVAVVAGIRFVPSVEAARAQSSNVIAGRAPSSLAGNVAGGPVSGQVSGTVAGQVTGQVSGEVSGEAIEGNLAQEAPPAAPPVADVEAPEPPDPPAVDSYSGDDDGDSFAIVSGDKDKTIHMNGGRSSKDFEKARQKYHGNFIWFERDGKSYVITDPAIVAQAQARFKMDGRLEVRQKELDRLQADLDKKMELLQPEIDKAAKPGPEFEAQMKRLNAELAKLQSEDFKKLTSEISKEVAQEKLAELQGKIGDIQGQIGEIQGEIGERVGRMGEKQGELGEQMGKIGEEMGRIGEEQGRKAEEAVRKLKPMLDQAVKDGKAKPVE